MSEQEYNKTKEAFQQATEKYKHLNQVIDEFKFEVISTLDNLWLEGSKMKNSVPFYWNKIITGDYLILTIQNINGDSIEDTFSHLGIDIKDGNLYFEQAKAFANYHCRESVINVIKKFFELNKIEYKTCGLGYDITVDKAFEVTIK